LGAVSMFRTSVLASLVLCFHQRCSSKEGTRCPKKMQVCPRDAKSLCKKKQVAPERCKSSSKKSKSRPKDASRRPKKGTRALVDSWQCRWPMHSVAQAKVVSECRCCDGHHIARRSPALAGDVCTGADPEQGTEMTMNKRSRLDRKIGQNNNVLSLQVARDRARQSRDGSNGHVSLSVSNSETTEVSHQRQLERLEAENEQLRGSVVELVLQIRALRGYLAGRLRSG
jgi:hypothetical protein